VEPISAILVLAFVMGMAAVVPAYRLAWRVRAQPLARAERYCRLLFLPLLGAAILVLFHERYPDAILALMFVALFPWAIGLLCRINFPPGRCWHHIAAMFVILGVLFCEFVLRFVHALE
jgi:hypothetical protein